MKRSEQINELAAALCKFQGEVTNPKKTANNPHFGRKYTPLDELVNTVKPIMLKHGLSFFQNTWTEGENVVITTMLLHESGQHIESDEMKLPGHQMLKGGGKAWNAQGAGSAITYGRRYQLSAVLGIASEEDDDGNDVSGGQGGGNKSNQSQKRRDEGQHREPAAANQQPAAADQQPAAATEGEPVKLSTSQVGLIKSLTAKVAKAAGKEPAEVEEKLKQEFSYKSTTELSKTVASKVITKLEEWQKKYNSQAS